MKQIRIALAVLLAATTFLHGQQTTANAPQITTKNTTNAPSLQVHNPRYQLRKSDTFDVEFAYQPEFNQSLTVGPDGFATFREIGSIHVEGATIPSLTETLKTLYSKVLHDPVIAISLKDFEKPYFIASGQVNKPGKYDLRGPMTVTQAVAIAGGFNNDAKHSQVVVFHPTDNGMYEAKLLDIKKILATRNLNEDIHLQPGDLVYVPASTISKIRRFWPNTVLGAYYNPATY